MDILDLPWPVMEAPWISHGDPLLGLPHCPGFRRAAIVAHQCPQVGEGCPAHDQQLNWDVRVWQKIVHFSGFLAFFRGQNGSKRLNNGQVNCSCCSGLYLRRCLFMQLLNTSTFLVKLRFDVELTQRKANKYASPPEKYERIWRVLSNDKVG